MYYESNLTRTLYYGYSAEKIVSSPTGDKCLTQSQKCLRNGFDHCAQRG